MKVRIISGVVGAILAVAILLLHKTFVFPLAIAALICIALFELFRAGKCLHCRIPSAQVSCTVRHCRFCSTTETIPQ